MGNGASSSVKTISINSSQHDVNETKVVKETSKSPDGFRLSRDNNNVDNTRFSKTEEENITKSMEVENLKKQLAWLESEKLDLLDRINLLEEQIEYLNTQNLLQSQKDSCEETIHAKNQYIEKLEKEKEIAEEDIKKLRLRMKRKVKNLSTQLTEVRQEASIQAFELRDEVNRLTEDNSKLIEKVRIRGHEGDLPQTNNFSLESDGGRSKLILELSQQLNEQNERIEELERTVRERDKTIEELNSMDKNDKHNVSNSSPKKRLDKTVIDNNSCEDKSLKSPSSNNDVSEMRSILSEMKNLRARNSRHSKEKKSSFKDNSRGSSGQSRDSGVISPTEYYNSGLLQDRPVSASSCLSELSDAALDRSSTDHAVAHSAPAGRVRNKPPISGSGIEKSGKTPGLPMGKEIRTGSKPKKKFLLKQRLESRENSLEEETVKKLATFSDSDVDTESEALLENFRQDPYLNVHSPSIRMSTKTLTAPTLS